MVITICMSMLLSNRLPALRAALEEAGHEVLLPVDTQGFDYAGASTGERAALKREHDLIREHWRKISARMRFWSSTKTCRGARATSAATHFWRWASRTSSSCRST